jgi:hypothetical protein
MKLKVLARLRRLRGRYRGLNLLTALQAERQADREREERKFARFFKRARPTDPKG